MTNEGYERLANAIVAQAAQDYRTALGGVKSKIKILKT